MDWTFFIKSSMLFVYITSVCTTATITINYIGYENPTNFSIPYQQEQDSTNMNFRAFKTRMSYSRLSLIIYVN